MILSNFLKPTSGFSSVSALGILGVCTLIASLIVYQFLNLDRDSLKLRILNERRILIQKILLAAEDPLSYDCSSASVNNPCAFKSSFLNTIIIDSTNALISSGRFEVSPKETSSFLVDDTNNVGKWFKAVLVFKTTEGHILFQSNIEVRLPADYFQVSSYVESGAVKGAICPINSPFFAGFDTKTGKMICTGNQNFHNCLNGFVSKIDGKTLTQTCTPFIHSILEAPSNSYIKDNSIHRDGDKFKMESVSRSGDPWEEVW